MRYIAYAFSYLAVLSCQTQSSPEKSQIKLDFSYKAQDAQAIFQERFAGRLKLIHEYEPTTHVVVSNYNNFMAGPTYHHVLPEYLKFIANAGAIPVIISAARDTHAQLRALPGGSNAIISEQGGEVWVRDYLARSAHYIDENNKPIGKGKAMVKLDYTARRSSDHGSLYQLHPELFIDTYELADSQIKSEWGNLVSVGNHIFGVLKSGEETMANFTNSKESDLRKLLKELSGLEPVFLESLVPYDATGHADMFMLPLSEKVVLMLDVDERAFDVVWPEDSSTIKDLKILDGIFDRNAEKVKGAGYDVIKVPVLFTYSEVRFAMRSMLNGLLVNNQLLMPHYGLVGAEFMRNEDVYRDMVSDAKSKIEGAASSLGIKTSWVYADALMSNNGVVHCTTMHIQ